MGKYAIQLQRWGIYLGGRDEMPKTVDWKVSEWLAAELVTLCTPASSYSPKTCTPGWQVILNRPKSVNICVVCGARGPVVDRRPVQGDPSLHPVMIQWYFIPEGKLFKLIQNAFFSEGKLYVAVTVKFLQSGGELMVREPHVSVKNITFTGNQLPTENTITLPLSYNQSVILRCSDQCSYASLGLTTTIK